MTAIDGGPCPRCGRTQQADLIDVTRAPGHPPEYLPGITRCANPQCAPRLITLDRSMAEDEVAAFRDRWTAAYNADPRPIVLPAPDRNVTTAESRADQRDIDMDYWGLTPLQRTQHLARVSSYWARRSRAYGDKAARLALIAACLAVASFVLAIASMAVDAVT